ncbi:MAG: N-acetylmuramoyl-L-alanine amidase [Ignavibacteriae bacterium]|nr:MAG: N-acetylmuramoyl-L-alanine amidase [Ignavibacteriota bacterium]
MKYSIAIDDGHGLETAGKRTPDGYIENNFNHFTKEFLKEELIFNGFTVVDASPDRSDNSLANRCEIANKAKADIFVSIHFNAMSGTWGSWAGIETYSYPGSEKGRKLATLVHQSLMKGTAMVDRGIKTAGFYVLKHTNMPAVLVECGFMDNKREALLMKSNEYRKECAIEICKGICKYFDKEYKPIEVSDDKIWVVQAGAFRNKQNAIDCESFLKSKGIDCFITVK